ncbi:MAG: hypothetical protein ACE5K0_06025 [Candidatus Methanofastidiosia archaeon]
MRRKLEKLRKFPQKRYLITLVFVSFLATLGLMYIMSDINTKLKSTEGSFDIVDFEFAFTEDKAREILQSWKAELQEQAKRSIKIDFPFIIVYSLFLSSLTLLLARTFKGTKRSIGIVLTLFPFLAGILDVLENVLLLSVLNSPNNINEIYVFIAGLAASVKFLLLSIVFLFLILGGGYRLAVGRRKR